MADEEDKKQLAWVLTPILGGAAALGTGALWFVGGRERKPKEVLGEYWREPLDERPAVALANLNRGTVAAGPTIAGTLVDLAQRGYIGSSATRRGAVRPGQDRAPVHLGAARSSAPMCRSTSGTCSSSSSAAAQQTTSEDVNDWAKQQPAQRRSRTSRQIKRGVKAEHATLGYETKVNGLHMGLLLGLCLLVGVGSWILKSYTDNGVAWVGVGAAVAALRRRLVRAAQPHPGRCRGGGEGTAG